MRRESHVRLCEGGGVRVPSATRLYRREVVHQLATATGDLVIAYDLGWRRLWTRRFNNPLSDAETFRVSLSGRLLEIGGKTDQIEAIQGQYMGLLKFTPPAWHRRCMPKVMQARRSGLAGRTDYARLMTQALKYDVDSVIGAPAPGPGREE